MKLINQPDNPAVLSNVGEIGEFRIRNSAKAFNILSSGLYANKIRAIIRELSCNAVDSHVAAGKGTTPFDVHIPNQFEPWFAIRDYGTGLSHEQVTNIYTTYFESTKTDSNEFIGALGLGSKSPFSYTDNFTVTAVKDGRRGIYSAFINDKGVPSIALMMEEQTTEPNGVEVKFSVNSNNDFYKFAQEAREVYKHFKLRPVVSGYTNWAVNEVEYSDKDIVPGVHALADSGVSHAVMGNIAYRIEVPNAEKNLGELAGLLRCSLELHFEIGELDFQASREGLSYIPSTIDAIKTKLEQLNAVLVTKLEVEADKITNYWDRAKFLLKKKEHSLWRGPAREYVNKTNFPLLDGVNSSYVSARLVNLFDDVLAQDYNISLRGFVKETGYRGVHAVRKHSDYGNLDSTGKKVVREYTTLNFSSYNTIFVKNDIKTGAYTRTKEYMRSVPNHNGYLSCLIMTAADPTKPVKFDEFLASIYNPPNVLLASSFPAKVREKTGRGTNVSIMHLEYTNRSRYRESVLVWRDAGKIDDLNDPNQTYYYLPLNGYRTVSQYGEMNDNKEFYQDLKNSGLDGMQGIKLYGVRKADLDAVKSHKNWVNIEDHVSALMHKFDSMIEMNLVLADKEIDLDKFWTVNKLIDLIENQNSPFLKVILTFKDLRVCRFNYHVMQYFYPRYLKKKLEIRNLVNDLQKKVKKVVERYALLRYLDMAKLEEIADYVNMVDRVKNV
jgi:hypothetical protein